MSLLIRIKTMIVMLILVGRRIFQWKHSRCTWSCSSIRSFRATLSNCGMYLFWCTIFLVLGWKILCTCTWFVTSTCNLFRGEPWLRLQKLTSFVSRAVAAWYRLCDCWGRFCDQNRSAYKMFKGVHWACGGYVWTGNELFQTWTSMRGNHLCLLELLKIIFFRAL